MGGRAGSIVGRGGNLVGRWGGGMDRKTNKQTNKQTINHRSVEVRAETSSKIAPLAINVPIGDTLSSVANCPSTDQWL